VGSLKCSVCGKENPEHLWRCEEHYRCDICFGKDDLVFRRGGVTCNSCHAERARKEVEAFDRDTDFTQEITCPWCGQEQSDSWDAPDECEHTCDNCGNEYSHVREIEVTYSTSKKE